MTKKNSESPVIFEGYVSLFKSSGEWYVNKVMEGLKVTDPKLYERLKKEFSL